MITHKIVVHRPHIVQRVMQHMQQQVPNHTPMVPANNNLYAMGMVRDQKQLEDHLKESHICEGMYITNKHSNPRSVMSIHYVMEAEKDYSKISFARDFGYPRCFRVIGCAWGTETPWIRWESHRDWRQISPEEYKQFVEPELDNIQNRIQKYK